MSEIEDFTIANSYFVIFSVWGEFLSGLLEWSSYVAMMSSLFCISRKQHCTDQDWSPFDAESTLFKIQIPDTSALYFSEHWTGVSSFHAQNILHQITNGSQMSGK